MKGQQITGPAKFKINGGADVDFGGNLPAGTYDVDCSRGNVFSGVLTGNITVNLLNLKPGCSCYITFLQDGTGGRTVTWAAADTATGRATVTAATAGGLLPAAGIAAETEFTLVGTAEACATAKVFGRAIV